MAADANPHVVAVDQALAAWRQGDCVIGKQWFVHRLDPARPLTQPGQTAAAENIDLAETEVDGLVVVTQTCDIVRSCVVRPFIEVCPVVGVDGDKLYEIERGRRPGFCYVPAIAKQCLVADLDRTMTVEKAVAANWSRTAGWTTDAQARAIATALARKRARFAFPDDFTRLAKKLQSRLAEKHGKASPEGIALRTLREIRVHAAPSWDDGSVTLTFWFIRPDEVMYTPAGNWANHLEEWLKLIPAGGRFVSVHGQVAALEDLNAAEYVSSDPLDLDYLSA